MLRRFVGDGHLIGKAPINGCRSRGPVVQAILLVHLPDRDEERGDDRAEHESGDPNEAQATEGRKQDQVVGHLSIAADQRGPQQVIHQAT